MNETKNVFISLFCIVAIVITIFIGYKLLIDYDNFEIEEHEVSLSIDTPYQINIEAENKKNNANNLYEYRSSDPKVASVDGYGLVTPRSSGTAEITVKKGDKEQVLKVKITDVPIDNIVLNSNTITVYENKTYNISSLIKKTDFNYNYTYVSSNEDVVTVDKSGIATAKKAGSAVITISTNNGINTNVSVTVLSSKNEATSIVIDNVNLNIKVGNKTTLNAYVYPDNASNKTVTWNSSDNKIATVDSNGTVTAISKGNAVITATTSNGISAKSNVTVVEEQVTKTTTTKKVVKTKKKTKTNTNTEVKSISLNKNNVTISVGGTTKVNYTINPSTATNKNVTWIVENNDITTVYKDGKIKGNKVGTTKVTVKTHNNKTATLTVNVISNTINPTGISLNVTNRTIYEGDSFSLISIITPDNATDKSVTWTSSNSKVAIVNNGRVTGIKAGAANITATTKNGKSATAYITVIKRVINPTRITLNTNKVYIGEGKSTTLVATITPDNATNKAVTWKSSNTNIATVTNGKVTGVSSGTATITATTTNGKSTTATVTVTKNAVLVSGVTLSPTSKSIVEGTSTTLTATISPTNATDKSITWVSSNTNIATVANGKVTAKKSGVVTITAKASNNKSATATITVTPKTIAVTSITLNKTSISLEEGKNTTLIATISPSNATNKAVTWKTSNSKVATVSNGKITAVKAGTATITATSNNGKTATANVTVKAKKVAPTGITLNKSKGTIRSTRTVTLKATISPSNATDKTVTWKSSNTKVATVSNGKILGKKAGTATITATTSNGKTAKYTVTVKQVRIAMIGNSKTHTSNGSVYDTFVKVMKNGGFDADIKKSTVGGTSLVEKARGKIVNTASSDKKDKNLKAAKKVITSNTFDTAILQEQTAATYNGKYYKTGVSEIRKLLMKNNDNVKIYLRQSWYFRSSFKKGTSSEQLTANKNAENIAKAYNLTVIKDGSAFLKYYQNTKDTKIFRDNTHGTNEGVYLAATCIYKTITGQDPTKLTYYGEGGVTKARAQMLQKIAKNEC